MECFVVSNVGFGDCEVGDCKGMACIIDDFVEDCVGGLMDWIDEVSTFTVD